MREKQKFVFYNYRKSERYVMIKRLEDVGIGQNKATIRCSSMRQCVENLRVWNFWVVQDDKKEEEGAENNIGALGHGHIKLKSWGLTVFKLFKSFWLHISHLVQPSFFFGFLQISC